jgi:Flp pilus assembly CpaF family ATPase
MPAGSAEADCRSSNQRVLDRPVAPAAGTATSPAPPSAMATAPALLAAAVMIQTSFARRIVGRVSEILVGGGFGQFRTATTGRVS